ncbi:potassium-transporting ATPase, A subunit [Thermobaculum terrenum ATCC BAA-798]|uniref:Potassium-transporting ATPase potassium-binding subunit n=1 Tax=Thermobaculum terrenum (strain ATCC BAA-798 / CCMEE 7001 / YNP1) TaxID=525904 RepID=D1CGX3_THET1|nr:potassium-transporting ATPase subunit KdpA [Thermobaculum terrenum]ACZ42994.1 potassium-transporting ATPase, A subunit [Thermobaculum terrenum ATCC BAA-798]
MSWLQIPAFLLVLLAITKPLGSYMARVYQGERTFLSPALAPLERAIYRVARVDPDREQDWRGYALALLLFNLSGMLALYALQRLQAWLPLNPEHLPGVAPDLAFNTAASFVTNTNWQAYAGETTMSYLTQMAGLTVQNFLSAAVGLAAAVALARGLTRRSTRQLGNFWVDVTRSVLYVLLPLAILGALLLVWQGVPQNLSPYVAAETVEGHRQILPQGPVASQEAIKLLGTNGGGFFNANSAHPYENPTPLTNFLEALYIFVVPAALLYTFGKMTGDTRQGWALWVASALLFLAGLGVASWAERAGNPLLAGLHVGQGGLAGVSMEGKEIRLGLPGTLLFSVVTTAASCGAVNGMLSSLSPLAGGVALFNMQLGEIIFGGVGSGLYGLVIYAMLAVFIAGLMVGRTPEYLGKKIEAFEIKMSVVYMLAFAAIILLLSAWAAAASYGRGQVLNPGPHGLSEIVYAYSSATGNNGSAFAGLSANTAFYNLTLGLAMLGGRFLLLLPVLAIAGSMARKRAVPPSLGTFPTNGGTFVALLVGTILIVGALTFFLVLSLGPVAEQLIMAAGKAFGGR